MRNKSVAVLDVRSTEICAAIAEKGVNNTFIIKSKYSRPYEGYAEGELLDVDDFVKAVNEAVTKTLSSVSAPVKEIFVSVPGEFTSAVQTDKVLAFQSAQRISSRHIAAITANSAPAEKRGETLIGNGALYYVLSDKRKLSDPIGMTSDSLRARLVFFTCKTVFIDTVKRALGGFTSLKTLHFYPQEQMEGQYLFNAEQRDGYSALFDFGAISSTFSVIYGRGVAYSESFSVGVYHVAVLLMEALDIPYNVAVALIKQVNLNARDRQSATEEYFDNGNKYSFSATELRSLIREGLDGVCEMVEACIQSFADKDMTGAPVYITGEGVGVIRGATEHFSARLVTSVEVAAPKIPYYDKPQFSSLFSLLFAALGGSTAI